MFFYKQPILQETHLELVGIIQETFYKKLNLIKHTSFDIKFELPGNKHLLVNICNIIVLKETLRSLTYAYKEKYQFDI